MLKGMQAKENSKRYRVPGRKGTRYRSSEKWFLYILRCKDLSLYTGITNNLEKRFKKHSDGKGARYTRTRLPLEMVYHESCKSRTAAMVRECAMKALPKKKKLALVEYFRSKAGISRRKKRSSR